LEHEKIAVEAIQESAYQSTARRTAQEPYVYVPMDGSSLKLTDPLDQKGFGMVGTSRQKGRGVQVLTALAVSPQGKPLGLLGQTYWMRKRQAKRGNHAQKRVEEKETNYSVHMLCQVAKVLQETGSCRPWFQIDRAGDAWPLWVEGQRIGVLMTVRSSWNRRLVSQEKGKPSYLWDAVLSQSVLGTYPLRIPAGPSRTERQGTMEVRTHKVEVLLKDQKTKAEQTVWLWAVHTKEQGLGPKGEDPLEWKLLTNVPCPTLEEGIRVLRGYEQRWRVEEFHKVWKSGACKVEESQLRAADHFLRWAVILASVAVRILGLTYALRTDPEAPALSEFGPMEVEAIVRLTSLGPARPQGPLTIREAVFRLAQLGGYTGKPTKDPPGPLVLARGLRYIEPVVRLLEDGSKL
jgi:hypothetical protein